MNLSKIDDKFNSHPEYSYKKHVKNIYDSFYDDFHKKTSLYHDVGKLSNEFQIFINNDTKNNKTTHALESGICFLQEYGLELTPLNFFIFLTIIKHHGDLPDVNDYVENYLADESYYEKLASKLNLIYNRAHIEEKYDLGDISNIFDTDSFVEDYQLISLDNYFIIKEIFSKLIFADKYEATFKEHFSSSAFDRAGEYIDKLLSIINSKKNKLSTVRNLVREDILKNYFLNKNKKIFIIEAPTGIGKTFTALNLALQIVKDKKKKRIITALPLTSIIDQTYQEYSKIIDSSELLKYHHLTHTKNYQYNSGDNNSYKQKNDYLTSSWCFDKVIITTFNQVFNAFYSNRNSDLTKFWTLRDSVIIFDEIQNIPRVLLKDIAKTMNTLSVLFNIDFILMSATVPAIKNFLDDSITTDLLDNKYFSMDFNNRYSLVIEEKIDSISKLSEIIYEKSKLYSSTLSVVNTKKVSLKLFEQLEPYYSKDELYLLNTNFIPLHRTKIINKIKNRLKIGKKVILVSTQVIEAGVDLDFDFGFREFAPLSSIIQTAGRINREGETENAKMIITGRIGNSPYNANDLSHEEVIDLLPGTVCENTILPYLKKYFNLVISKTRPDFLLIENMKHLDFITTYKVFEENYMPDTPGILPIFIETEQGVYEIYRNKLDSIFKKLKEEITLQEKLTLKSELKDIYKKISYNVIHISYQDAQSYSEFYSETSMRFCPYHLVVKDSKYSERKGWINKSEALYF